MGNPFARIRGIFAVHIVHLKVDQQPGHRVPAALGNRWVVPLQHRQVDARVLAGLQIDIPIALKQRLKAEVVDVERCLCSDLRRHDHRVELRTFHGCLLKYIQNVCGKDNNIQSACMSQNTSRSNAERSETTRAALLKAARALFLEKGFAGTSTPDIVGLAHVTRGALYHHFTDKADVFRAVALEMAQEVAAAIDSTPMAGGSAFDELRQGAAAYFNAMADSGRARLLLLDAPTILPATAVADISHATGADQLRDGLTAALGAQLDASAIQPLAHMLSAAFDRAALMIASGQDASGPVRAMELMIDALQAWAQRPQPFEASDVQPVKPLRRRAKITWTI